MSTTQAERAVPGDVVEVVGRRVGDAGRAGEIVEVLGEPQRPHYLVRWEDGHESVLYPAEGTTIRKQPQRAAKPTPQLDIAAVTGELVERVREAGFEFELLPHRRTTTAANEARVLGVVQQTVAKTVVARDAEGRCVRAVVPASHHVDLAKLARAAGAQAVTLLTETELVAAYPEFELGAVPPFGGPAGDRVIVDRQLIEYDHVVLDAGVHDTSLRLRPEDLVAVAEAEVADVARSG